MGRIAEALKRAQQERSRCTGDSFGAPVSPSGSPAEVTAPTVAAVEMPGTASAVDPAQLSVTSTGQPFFVTAPPIVPDQVAPEVVVFHQPHTPIAERYRSARTRLVTGNPSGGARVLAITSSQPKEGKTVTTANLGFGLAELRHLRIAMMDCDFHRKGLSSLFGVSDKPGLAEVIRGERSLADVCIPVVRENLFLVPVGDPGSSMPSELLTGASAAATFREINQRFHYSLIDTPPTDAAADIGLIAPLCHSVIIVIRMNHTPEHLMQRCVRMLQANRVEIAGSILVGYCEKTMGYVDSHDYYEARA